ncbi:hypothetical protein [Desulfonatronovibrio magnus]
MSGIVGSTELLASEADSFSREGIEAISRSLHSTSNKISLQKVRK